MSWGVATQNGVSVSLTSIVSLSAGVTEFSPADLFTGGVQGAWYAPDDFSTLFQDSAGTTPVTAVEQPVGLMLDKSQGLVLGSELVTNGDFASSSGWTLPGVGTNSITGGQAVLSGASGYLLRTGTSITAGQWYRVSFTVTGYSGSGTVRPYIQASPVFGSNVTGNGTFVQYLLATTTNANTEIGLNFASSFTGNIDDISIKSFAGNHASQSTSTSRPVLRARYNLLTYSEQFDNATAWTPTSATISPNTTATTDPLGGNTADSIIAPIAANSQHRVYQAFSASTYTLSIYAKAGTASFISLSRSNDAAYATFNLSTGAVSASAGGTGTIESAGNGWWRCIFTSSVATSYLQVAIGTTAANAYPNAAWVGAGENVFLWGAQAVTGSSAGTYQRIAAATDYATAGFLPYLAFDGTDDSFGTNSINFSATDKMSVCAGVTKLSDAAYGAVVELSAAVDSNNGSFAIFNPNAAEWETRLKGDLANGSYRPATFTAPITNVVTLLGDLANPTSAQKIIPRINGVIKQNTFNGGAIGTGNFGNYPLYIGRRNNVSLPFNGRIYQMVVCGKTLSAAELAATESYVATKTGVTL